MSEPQVVAYDFGIKTNILRRLASFGCRITVVPATYPASEVLKMNPDGVFFSNGPVSAALGCAALAASLPKCKAATAGCGTRKEYCSPAASFRNGTGHPPKPAPLVVVPSQGDPSAAPYAVDNAKAILGKKPVFGICMGHQVCSGFAMREGDVRIPYKQTHQGGTRC